MVCSRIHLEAHLMDMSLSIGDNLTDPLAEIKEDNSLLSSDWSEEDWSDTWSGDEDW